MSRSSVHTPDAAPDSASAFRKPVEDRLVLTISPKAFEYLDALVEADLGFGDTRQDVARYLIWDAINRLIERGLIDRIDS